MSEIQREVHQLHNEDVERLQKLPHYAGFGFRFWAEICTVLGLDLKSVITQPGYKFSALPRGHGKPWCWPKDLKCQVDAGKVAL